MVEYQNIQSDVEWCEADGRMKRLVLILLVVLSGGVLCGQSLELPEHALGIKGGTTWSWMRFDPSVSQPAMPLGVNAGIQYRMILEKYFGLWLELNYEQRGFRTEGIKREMDYIELPMLAHFTFGKKMFRFYFNLGPSVGVMLKDHGLTGGETPEHTLPVKNKFDWGLTGGVGFELNTIAGIYTVGARYNFGFGNVFDVMRRDGYIVSSNQNISLSLGWMWKIRNSKGKKYVVQ